MEEALPGARWATWNSRALNHSESATKGAKLDFARKLLGKATVFALQETRAPSLCMRRLFRSSEQTHWVMASGESTSWGGVALFLSKRVFASQPLAKEIVRGRVLAVETIVETGHVTIVTIHNFGISAMEMRRVVTLLNELVDRHESEPHRRRAIVLGDVNFEAGREVRGRVDRTLHVALRRWVEMPVGHPTHFSPGSGVTSEIDRCWALMPRSLMAVARPRSELAAQPDWVYAQGLSDHAPVVVEWPTRSGMQRARRPISREVAEDSGMPQLLKAMGDYAKLDDAAELQAPEPRWRQHKALLKESARMIRDRRLLSGGGMADSGASHSARLLTLARAVWAMDHGALRALRRHWPEFSNFVVATSEGFVLSDPAAFEAQLKIGMTQVMDERVGKMSRESKRGSRAKRRVSRVSRAGALRAAALWRSRAPSVQLSGIRIVDAASPDEQRVVTEGGEMADVVREHWLPVFQAPGEDSAAMREEVKRWATPWDFSALALPDEERMTEHIRRTRSTAPGPDGVPYAMWKATGTSGARTLRRLLASFADGAKAPEGFNEAWLALLPKGEEPEDMTEHRVRAAKNLRPLLLKNTDSKIVASALARGLRPILAASVHQTQRGFVMGREMSRNVLELDTYARAMHSTVLGSDLPALLLCDMTAAFPSINRYWMYAVLQCLGMPLGAVRVVEAIYDEMVLMTRLGGCQTIGDVTSGIPQGCPLSGALFVMSADPLGRRLHEQLVRGKAGMVRQGADDTAVLVRSVRLLSLVEPVFRDAARYAGVRLKPEKCVVVLVGSKRDEEAEAEAREVLRTISTAWADFRVTDHGKYLGYFVGPGAGEASWEAPLEKWEARTREIASRGAPAEAAGALYRQRAVSVLTYVGALTPAPARIEEKERHLVGRLLHLPGGALPQRGHVELTEAWGWPQVGCVEAALAVEARERAERTRRQWQPMVAILDGAWCERPLAHLADGVRYDERWRGLPAALHLQSAVSPDSGAGRAMKIVAGISEEVWRKSGRGEKERLVAEGLRPVWVARAVAKRMRQVLLTSERPGAPEMDSVQIERVRLLVCTLSPAWAVTASRTFLNLWTTSHRVHDEVRDACYWGCEAVDSLGHYLTCEPLRMIVAMFDDEASPYDEIASFYGIGPGDACPSAQGAMRRAILACHAYHTVRATRRERGMLEAAEADGLARRAVVEIAGQVALFWARRGRHEPPHRAHRPLAHDAPPFGDAVGAGPPRAAGA